MSERGKWIAALAGVFCLGLVGSGAGVVFYMDAAEQRELTEETRSRLTTAEDNLKQAQNDNDELSRRIADLEKKLKEATDSLAGKDEEMRAQRERLLADNNEQVARERRMRRELQEQNAEQRQQRDNRGRRGGFDLERLKTENPEQYRQIMQRREEMRQRMEQRQNRRAEILNGLNTASMSADKRAKVERYRELTAQAEQMRAQFQNMTPEERRAHFQNMSDEERRNQMQAGREAFREMMELQNVVRDEAVNQAVKSGDTNAVKEAMEVFGGPGGGPGGPGGGPGGFGGGRGGFGGGRGGFGGGRGGFGGGPGF